jgi:hypothetical protein
VYSAVSTALYTSPRLAPGDHTLVIEVTQVLRVSLDGLPGFSGFNSGVIT